nr:MraY family glycosyltransferase [Nanchangia anserum]
MAFTYLATPIVRRLALAWHALTPVRDRDVHTHPIPRLGGIAMTWGFAATMIVGSRFPYFHEFFTSAQAWWILAGACAICALGVIDDVWDLDWWAKLAGQLFIVGLVAWNGVQVVSFPLFGVTVGSARVSIAVTVLVIVTATNAVNFVDGLDGLAAGTVAIGAGGYFVYTYLLVRMTNAQSYASVTAMLMVVLVGICLGFLCFNFHPATIFMGDCGAMLLGYVVGVAFILVTGQIDTTVFGHAQMLPAILPFVLPVATLMLPLLDMTMAVVRRLRAGQTPFHPDRKHLHHRLLAASHSHRKAVVLMYALSAAVAVGAISFLVLPWPGALGLSGTLALVVMGLLVVALPGMRQKYVPWVDRVWQHHG